VKKSEIAELKRRQLAVRVLWGSCRERAKRVGAEARQPIAERHGRVCQPRVFLLQACGTN